LILVSLFCVEYVSEELESKDCFLQVPQSDEGIQSHYVDYTELPVSNTNVNSCAGFPIERFPV